MSADRLRKYAWFVLAYNVGVILFGAVVRATGSGAGCGSDWPACRGGIVPLEGTAETVIEFTHRATSGIALVLVFVLLISVLRRKPSAGPARIAAIAAAGLVVSEALVGAMLVLFGWVEDDQSMGRAISIAVHLINTFLLLGALSLTAWWLGEGSRPGRPFPVREKRWMGLAAAGLILVGIAGAITALGDTLFPAESIFAGIRDDFTGTFLVRLRWIHPILAVAAGLLLVWLAPRYARLGSRVQQMGAIMMWLVIGQLMLGFVNVLLLAPVWMQVVHLLAADLTWIVFVLFAVETLAATGREAERATR
ncbi:MAG: COX15/CtaA family protein [Acidimicrobiia bacterium]|nr:COX15/CtaA family protein [Acidimicrobiia bacterium]